MGLNFTLPTATIEFSGGNITVRGLGLEDFTILVRRHSMQLTSLFGALADAKSGQIDLTDFASLAAMIADSAPIAAAEAICLAADAFRETFDPSASSTDDIITAIRAQKIAQDEQIELVRRLPISVQIDVLEQIGKLTFQTEGSSKKVWETVISVMNGTKLLTEKSSL